MANRWVTADTLAGPDQPAIRRIEVSDLKDVLMKGIEDFKETPTQLAFLCLIYPLVGLFAARAAANEELLPLFYPLVAGLSIMGPVAAVGIYEISRRREHGLPTSWLNAFDVLKSPALFSIATLGVLLLAIFVAWVASAQAIYDATFGGVAPDSVGGFLREVLTTGHGWQLIILGNLVGFVYAVVVLTLTVVSVPLLLDRNVGVVSAIQTSIRAVATNPVPMAVWGLIVAAMLLIGSLPFFVGLAIAMPILGHSTWHLYRKVVAH
jgi:uncharacterized membrane protein